MHPEPHNGWCHHPCSDHYSPVAVRSKSSAVIKFCPLALAHTSWLTNCMMFCSQAVWLACAHMILLNTVPSQQHREVKCKSRGTTKRTKRSYKTDRCTHRTNLQPNVMHRLISRNTFGYSDVEKQNCNSSFSPRIFRCLSNSIIELLSLKHITDPTST